MPFQVFVVLVLSVPLGALTLALYSFALLPKRKLLLNLAIALLAPLFALIGFTVNAYQHSNWFPFSYATWGPHLAAGAISLALTVLALRGASGSIVEKVVVGVLALFAWVGLWIVGVGFTNCAMGDCI